MSILDIPTKPNPRAEICKACRWIQSLSDEELAHYRALELNYTVAELSRVIRASGSGFGESTLRKHTLAAH